MFYWSYIYYYINIIKYKLKLLSPPSLKLINNVLPDAFR